MEANHAPPQALLLSLHLGELNLVQLPQAERTPAWDG